MENIGFTIRRAGLSEGPVLTELALRSKSLWDYPKSYLEGCRGVTFVDEEYITNWPVFVAERDGEILGFCSIKEVDGEHRLDHLWIDLPYLKQGVGTKLYNCAKKQAALFGWEYLRIASEPDSVQFYEKLGAHKIGTIQSRIKPDLFLPHMEEKLK